METGEVSFIVINGEKIQDFSDRNLVQGTGLVSELINADEVLTLKVDSMKSGCNSYSSGQVMVDISREWKYKVTVPGTANEIETPVPVCITLRHELIHAWADLNNMTDYNHQKLIGLESGFLYTENGLREEQSGRVVHGYRMFLPRSSY